MPSPALGLSGLQGQPMFQILAECLELERSGRRILHFEIGDPDFDTPSVITDACIQSLRNGNTHYVSAKGDADLVEAVRMTTAISRRFIPEKEQITVTTGANSSIYYSIKAICDQSDEILLPDPYFPTYIAAVKIAGATPVFYPLSKKDNYLPDISCLEKLVTTKTKAILVNSPSNPTGTVYGEDTIRQLYEFAVRNDLYIISDEVYSRMIFDKSISFSSPSMYDSCKERSIVINGFSKAFAMTGWRVGVVIAPPDISRLIALLSESIVSCVPGFIQDAARAAILCPRVTTQEMYSVYRKRQLRICEQLQSAGVDIDAPPQGGMYVFAPTAQFAMDSESFAFHLLRQSGIATIPGVYFGTQGEGHLRFSCAGSDTDIDDLGAYFHNALSSYTGN